MSRFKGSELHDRQSNAAAAKKQMLEKFRAASQDPGLAERQAARAAIHEARLAREAEREKARKIREAELPRKLRARPSLPHKLRAKRKRPRLPPEAEEAERALTLAAEQKAARDERYAARKAAKKARAPRLLNYRRRAISPRPAATGCAGPGPARPAAPTA